MTAKTGKVILFMGAGQPLDERSYPLPGVLDPQAMLVKMSMATICGSDVHSWRGRRPFPHPAVLGHEGVGVIESMGAKMATDTAGRPIAIGDRIAWSIMAHCGHCRFCQTYDLPQKCLDLFKYGHTQSDRPPHFTGTLAEYVYIKPGTAIFKVPNDMTDEEVSPLMCAASTVTAGLDRIGLQTGENLLIQGAGMLGLYAAALAKEQGAKQVIVLDNLENRLDAARDFGADQTLCVQGLSDEEVAGQIRDWTDGLGADVVIEVAGFASIISLGVQMLRIGGRYLLMGSVYPDDHFTLASHDIITKCLTLKGLHNYGSHFLGLAMERVYRSRQRYPYRKLVGPQFPLTAEGVTAALSSLEGHASMRPVVTP